MGLFKGDCYKFLDTWLRVIQREGLVEERAYSNGAQFEDLK